MEKIKTKALRLLQIPLLFLIGERVKLFWCHDLSWFQFRLILPSKKPEIIGDGYMRHLSALTFMNLLTFVHNCRFMKDHRRNFGLVWRWRLWNLRFLFLDLQIRILIDFCLIFIDLLGDNRCGSKWRLTTLSWSSHLVSHTNGFWLHQILLTKLTYSLWLLMIRFWIRHARVIILVMDQNFTI